MADPRRLKNKGGHTSPPATVYELSKHDPLYFMTGHEDPWQFDLHVFETGLAEENISNLARSNGSTAFTGRSQLIRELAPAIYARYQMAPAGTGESVESSLRWWWRFLDKINDALHVKSVADFNELHYAHYRHLGHELPGASTASCFFTLLDHARELLNETRPPLEKLHQLEWTAVSKSGPERVLITFKDVKRLYEHLKHISFPVIRRFENNPDAIPTRAEARALFTLFILQTGWNESTALNIDVELRDQEGKLKCIQPNPLNPTMSILKGIDSEADDSDPKSQEAEESSTVLAPKPRAGGVIQRANSRNKQALSPGNIILAMTRHTESLRNRLRHYRRQLEKQLEEIKLTGRTGRDIDKLIKEIKQTSLEIKSPWLYYTPENVAGARRRKETIAKGISSTRNDTLPINTYAKEINKRLKQNENPITEDISLRDLRDAFIAWRWMTSHSWLDAMLAAGHSNRQSLVRYLKRKQIRERHHRQFLKVSEAVWDTAVKLRVMNGTSEFATVIAAKVAGVSEIQIKRWCEGKDQTYVGTGCLDFFHPPNNISPLHIEGTGCRVQRCTLCPHALLLPNSANLLARRLAELRHARRNMPEKAWQEGDYPQELLNTEYALQEFDRDEVSIFLTDWETQITEGRHRPILMEGAYV